MTTSDRTIAAVQRLTPDGRAQATKRVLPVKAAILAALGRLRNHQRLNAAAFCNAAGDIRVVREDVGRHNAFDKVIGAMAMTGDDIASGFILLSSRCTYELVEKAVRARVGCLVTFSTVTSLAVERARQARLRLIMLARIDALLALTID